MDCINNLHPRVKEAINDPRSKIVLVTPIPLNDDGNSIELIPSIDGYDLADVAESIGIAISGLMTTARKLSDLSCDPAAFMLLVANATTRKPEYERTEQREGNHKFE